jgi:hypothetical protein
LSKKILAQKGFLVKTFATPFGDNDKVIELVKKHYSAQRGTEKIRGPQLELSLNELDVDSFHISSIELHYDYSLEKIKGLIDKAVAEKKWAVFYLHGLTESRPEEVSFQFEAGKLSMVGAYLRELQDRGLLEVVTVAEFVDLRGKK